MPKFLDEPKFSLASPQPSQSIRNSSHKSLQDVKQSGTENKFSLILSHHQMDYHLAVTESILKFALEKQPKNSYLSGQIFRKSIYYTILSRNQICDQQFYPHQNLYLITLFMILQYNSTI
jgi:hypothetical protein